MCHAVAQPLLRHATTLPVSYADTVQMQTRCGSSSSCVAPAQQTGLGAPTRWVFVLASAVSLSGGSAAGAISRRLRLKSKHVAVTAQHNQRDLEPGPSLFVDDPSEDCLIDTHQDEADMTPGSRAQFSRMSMMHRPCDYPAGLLLGNGHLHRHGRVSRRVLVDEIGLRSRDIVALFSKDRPRTFDLTVRSGGVLLSLGKDGPAMIVSPQAAWILHEDMQWLSEQGLKASSEVVQQAFLQLAGRPAQESQGYKDASASAPARNESAEKVRGEAVYEVRRSEEKPSLLHPFYGTDLSTSMTDSLGSLTSTGLPFALMTIEAALLLFLNKLNMVLKGAKKDGCSLLNVGVSRKPPKDTTFQLELLRRTKRTFDKLRGQSKEMQKQLIEVLGDEDDMQMLAKTGATVEEWELCFEYYSQQAEEVSLEAFQQLEGLDDLESSISLSLSYRRLELEKLQLYLDVFGNALGVGALLTGAFGMNLMSGLEEKRRLFWPVSLFILAACVGSGSALRSFIERRLYPSASRQAFKHVTTPVLRRARPRLSRLAKVQSARRTAQQ